MDNHTKEQRHYNMASIRNKAKSRKKQSENFCLQKDFDTERTTKDL